MKSFGIRPGKSARVLLSSSCLVAALALPQATAAMEFHRNGDKIYVSGGFDVGDEVKLQRMLDAAQDAGIEINTVVFRTSPGGAAIAGKEMGNLIRERGLNTAVQGGCYSACTAGFVGGSERHDAIDDLPSVHPDYERTVFGIHGSASSEEDPEEYDVSVTTVSADQSDIVNHYHGLLEGEIPQEAMERIDYAITHLKDSQGFLRYFVNDDGKVTTYCPSAGQGGDDCIQYPGVTIRSDGIVNADKLDLSDDYLWVRDTVSGNINPNFRRFAINPESDDAPSLEEAYGVIRVADGGVWHMTEATGADIIAAEKGGTIVVEPGTAAPAQLIEDIYQLDAGILTFPIPQWSAARPTATWITASNGGTIDLRGGILSSDLLTTIRNGGTLSGYGAIASNLSAGAGAVLVPDAITVQPFLSLYQEDRLSPSRVNLPGKDVLLTLGTGSETVFNFSANDTGAKIRLVEAETIVPRFKQVSIFIIDSYVAEVHRGRLVIAPDAIATVNVQRSFHAAGARSTWVDVDHIEGPAHGRPDTTDFEASLFGSYFPPKTSRKPIIEGRFGVVRRDGSDAGIAFEDGAIFSPRENSLLTFTLHQDAESIYMTANPAFEDVGLFGNARSGNGLGLALRRASNMEDPRLAPLLGSLQFANRDIARREAGSLRGDGHATLRLASANFAQLFDSTLRTQVAGMRRLNGANFIARPPGTLAGEAASGTAGRPVSPGPYDASGMNYWIAGFGQTGRIASGGGVDRMEHDAFGSLFGVSRQIDGNASVGAAFGYGKMQAKERYGSGLTGDVTAYGGSVYGDYTDGSSYVSLQAGYHWLDTDTDRTVLGIEGLEGLHRADYTAKALTASFEHGITLTPGSPTRVTFVGPTVEYARLTGIDFVEDGGPAALVGDDGSYESVRIGAGLELTQDVTTAGGQRFAPYARALYKRELGDREAILLNGFTLDPGLGFAAASRKLGRDLIEWGVGVSSPADQRVTISVGYAGQAMGGIQNHSARLALSARF